MVAGIGDEKVPRDVPRHAGRIAELRRQPRIIRKARGSRPRQRADEGQKIGIRGDLELAGRVRDRHPGIKRETRGGVIRDRAFERTEIETAGQNAGQPPLVGDQSRRATRIGDGRARQRWHGLRGAAPIAQWRK